MVPRNFLTGRKSALFSACTHHWICNSGSPHFSYTIFFNSGVKASLALRASAISNNALHILSLTVWFYHPGQTPALFDLAFLLCGGGQADSLAAQSLNTEFISLQITNNKPLGAPFANKGALFLSLFLISKMLISTRRACGSFLFSFHRNV